MNQALIFLLIVQGCLLSTTRAANCLVGNPCQLGGYFDQENGYQCIQIDTRALCTCPNGGYEFDQPCRVCARSNSALNACQQTAALLTCLETDEFGTSYACLCQGASGVYTTTAANCDPSVTLTTSLASSTVSSATTTLVTTLPPCDNGGSFVDNVCNCPSAFSGIKCQTKEDARLCDNIVCKNQGVCAIRNPKGPYESVCFCRSGFWGDYCEMSGTLGSCTTGLCLNGGQCRENLIATTRHAYCQCLPGYNGSKCENRYFQCTGAGNFEDSFMKEQGKYFTCTSANGGYRLEQMSCAKGLRFNTSKNACTIP